MKKDELSTAVTSAKTETRNALQTVYDTMNYGLQRQIIKNMEVKALFDLYGVDYSNLAED